MFEEHTKKSMAQIKVDAVEFVTAGQYDVVSVPATATPGSPVAVIVRRKS
jgi:hypothetical protein